MVSRSREISNQVQVAGCDDGRVKDDIVNQMTGNWELVTWRDNMTDDESR